MKTEESKLDWKERIGKYAYHVSNSSIFKKRIDEGRLSFHLNTGSDRHGRLLDAKYEYRFEREREWYNKDVIFFSKDEIIENL